MNKDEEEMKELANTFRGLADDIDQLVILSQKEKQGEDIKEESETILGKFMYKIMKVQKVF